MGEICILDLDSNSGEKKYIMIDGEKIYYKKVPAMTTMLYDQVVNDGRNMQTVEDSFDIMKKLARAVLITLNYGRQEKLTEDWLLERCEHAELNRIIAALHEPLKKNIQELNQETIK